MKEIFQPICEAVQLKQIQYVGVSNFSVEQIQEVKQYVEIHSVQNVFNIFKMKDDVLNKVQIGLISTDAN